jgi:hypothetical protein
MSKNTGNDDVAAASLQASAQPTPHTRTPNNTPIPGGGRWAWDADAGAWVSRDSAPEPQPAQE